MTTEDIFGPVLYSYPRAQAIEDGVLVDVSDSDAASLYKYPVVVTQALHAALSVGRGKEPDTYTARLRDVFSMAIAWSRGTGGGEDVYFPVKVGRKVLRLRVNCGPGDNAEPVLTFGFPEDF